MSNKQPFSFTSEQGQHLCELYTPENCTSPQATVLVFPDWSGCSALNKHYAQALTECGYVAIAVDIYGDAKVADADAEREALLAPLKNNRNKLLSISQAALVAAQEHPLCDKDNIAAIGFCLGGLAALDLARAGSDVKGICSFHADLKPSQQIISIPSDIQVLVQHADQDEWVSFEDLSNLRNELRSLEMSWEMAIYSNVKHGFMNFNEPSYDEFTATKAWEKLQLFLYDVFIEEAAEEDTCCDSPDETKSDCCGGGSCSGS